ncbi:hypothetical protein BH20ACI2_BH20ACI2_06310 [soil metagenome]
MKTLILALTAIAILSVTVQTQAKTNETVKVDFGNSRTADRGRIKIRFLSIVEDSRCPRDATCVWAGNAKIRIAVSKGLQSRILELNTDLEPRTQNVFGYKLQLTDLHLHNGDPAAQKTSAAVISVKRS